MQIILSNKIDQEGHKDDVLKISARLRGRRCLGLGFLRYADRRGTRQGLGRQTAHSRNGRGKRFEASLSDSFRWMDASSGRRGVGRTEYLKT